MYSAWVIFILILISSFPVIAAYIWFRAAKYQFSITWFFSALLAGAAAFFPALFFQDLLIGVNITGSRAALLFEYFIRVAFSEEISRFLVLLVFFRAADMIVKKKFSDGDERQNTRPTFNSIKIGAAAGLIAGIGFSILETARYTASGAEINIILLRFFTAAIHGACGSRIGTAAVMLRSNPFQAVLRILTAAAIHGIFNLMVTIPGFPSIAAFVIAVSALTTAVLSIRGVNFSAAPNSKAAIDKNEKKS